MPKANHRSALSVTQRMRKILPLSAGVGLLGVSLLFVPWINRLEETGGLSLLFMLRGAQQPAAPVVIVSIDRASGAAMGFDDQTETWPRSVHARLVTNLAEAGVAVTAFDVSFAEARDGEMDALFAEAIADAGNVILLDRSEKDFLIPTNPALPDGAELVQQSRNTPIELLKSAALGSAPFALPVVPIQLSRYWLFSPSFPDLPTLPVTAFQAFALPVYDELIALLCPLAEPGLVSNLPATRSDVLERGRLEEVVRDIRRLFLAEPGLGTALSEQLRTQAGDYDARSLLLLRRLVEMYSSGDSAYLNFYGPPRTLTTIPFGELASERFDRSQFPQLDGAVAFVGISEPRQPNQQDVFYSVFSEASGLNLSGVEIAGTAFSNLLEDKPVRQLPYWIHALTLFLFGVVVTAAAFLVTPLVSVGLSGLLGIAYLGLAQMQFSMHALWLPLIVPLVFQLPLAMLGVTVWKHRRVRLERDRSRAALSHYVPSMVLNRLFQETTDAAAGHRLLSGTCLVTDATGYTKLSETLSPLELTEFMNRYYGVLVGIVEKRGGMVADLAGDSMVAVWPESDRYTASAAQACGAALDILTDLAVFNAKASRHFLPTRVGLHQGEIVFGTVGAGTHYEYRAVGDTVNTASRIQGLNKQLRTDVLVSEATLAKGESLLTRKLGSFHLAGKDAPLAVHELMGFMRGKVDRKTSELIERFEQALRLFSGRNWNAAMRAFENILERYPNDGPSLFYARVCIRYADRGLDETWDGSVEI